MPKIRERFFVGVEGESERGLIAWLRDVADEMGLFVHYDVRMLEGGDPLHMIEKALRLLKRTEPGLRAKLVVIDADRFHADRGRGDRAARLAEANNVRLFLQEPDHEALLLRLHDGHERDRPPSPGVSALRPVWPDYRKPATRRVLQQRFTSTDLHRARLRNRMLDDLLTALHLPRAVTEPTA